MPALKVHLPPSNYTASQLADIARLHNLTVEGITLHGTTDRVVVTSTDGLAGQERAILLAIIALLGLLLLRLWRLGYRRRVHDDQAHA